MYLTKVIKQTNIDLGLISQLLYLCERVSEFFFWWKKKRKQKQTNKKHGEHKIRPILHLGRFPLDKMPGM